MEYGEEDDDDIDSSEESLPHDAGATGVQKPFWALWATRCILDYICKYLLFGLGLVLAGYILFFPGWKGKPLAWFLEPNNLVE